MKSTALTVLTGKELVQAGQQAKAHIDAAQRHEGKAEEQYKAAGAYLAQAKRSVKHGQWLGWLGQYKIAERTAQRCLLIYEDPNAYEAELNSHAQQNTNRRTFSSLGRKSASTGGYEPEPREVRSQMKDPDRIEEDERTYALRMQRQPVITGAQLAMRARLNDVLARLSEEQLKQVLEFATKLEKTRG